MHQTAAAEAAAVYRANYNVLDVERKHTNISVQYKDYTR